METLSAHSRANIPPVGGRHHVELPSDSSVVGLTRPTTSPPSSSNKQASTHPRPQPPVALGKGLGAKGYVSVQPSAAPDSQESSTSTGSTTSTVPRLQTASSNVSQITVDTDLTSPPSSSPAGSQSQTGPEKPVSQSVSQGNAQDAATAAGNGTQPRTPEPEPGTQAQVVPGSAAKSPVTVVTPVNGAKRTADGMVKSMGTSSGSPAQLDVAGRSRAESLSSSGSKASEAAATLKTRLAYAMAKVQHGWEHKNLDQVEQLVAAQVSPRTSQGSPNGSRRVLPSPRSTVFPRPQSSGLSNGTARLSMHEAYGQLSPPHSAYSYAPSDMASPPSKRHSGNSLASWASQSQQHHSLGPALAPAAEIRPLSSNRRTNPNRLPPNLGTTHGGSSTSPPRYANNLTNATSHLSSNPPQTPKAAMHRPNTLRTKTQTQQAEQDAMDALMLMGSPNNQNFPQNRSSQQSSALPSPLRTEFPRSARAWAKRSESNESSLSAMSQESSASRVSGGAGAGAGAGPAAAKEVTGRVLDEVEQGR